MLAAAIGGILAACGYDAGFADCTVACDETSCPEGLTCSFDEGLCRTGATSASCAMVLADAEPALCTSALSCWEVQQGERYCAVSSDVTHVKGEVQVATLAGGDLGLAWDSDGQDGDQRGVQARVMRPDLAACNETTVNTMTAGVEARPAVVALPSGRWWIAWQVGTPFTTTTARAMREDGMPASNEVPIGNVIGTDNADLELAPHADGFVVAYTEDYHDAYPNYDRSVVTRAFDLAGTPTTAFQFANTYVPASQWKSAVTSLTSGGFLVAWSSEAQDGDQGGIYARQYDGSGVAIGGEHQLNTTTVGDQTSVALATAGGLVVAVWQSSSAASGYDVVAQMYDPVAGARVGSEIVVNTTTTGDQTLPRIATLSSGVLVVVWEGPDASGAGRDIYAREIQATPTLAPVGSELRINPYVTGDQVAPRVARRLEGYAVVWSGAGEQDPAGVFIRALP